MEGGVVSASEFCGGTGHDRRQQTDHISQTRDPGLHASEALPRADHCESREVGGLGDVVRNNPGIDGAKGELLEPQARGKRDGSKHVYWRIFLHQLMLPAHVYKAIVAKLGERREARRRSQPRPG